MLYKPEIIWKNIFDKNNFFLMLHSFFKISILTQNILLKMLGIFQSFKVNVELDIII